MSFQLFNTLLGLVANLLAVGAVIFGVVDLKPGWGPLSQPGPVLTLLYLSMVLTWLLVGFWIIGIIKRRYGVGPNVTIRPTAQWKGTFEGLMYIVTLSTTVLWILAWIALLGLPSDSKAGDDGLTLLAVGGFTLFFGGHVASTLVMKIDWLFNPTHYTEHP